MNDKQKQAVREAFKFFTPEEKLFPIIDAMLAEAIVEKDRIFKLGLPNAVVERKPEEVVVHLVDNKE